MGDLSTSSDIAVSGMKAQAKRLRIISENLANADSVAKTKGGKPYQRQVVTFKAALDKNTGADIVEADKVVKDKSDFNKKYDPHHPSAGADGYVLYPNVNPLVEMMDMKEAQRSYEANLNIIKTSKDMMKSTIDLLK